ncbi:MAG: ABC transporter substrate-binding protein [Betaproteobacteria bacterium]|nr:ABC transporter substrate-binding protein [Betaproteobacteria bacterium]MDE2003758.1 ABC transporter substrate-binding protein [Betaproteobacteria bacterium]MDE2208160.1 ABC transporter substrate-binding protein [Betaproteobacteria bacterium]
MQRSTNGALALVCALALSIAALPARAEMSEIHVAEQYGISYLPLMIMQDRKLIEKHAKAEGIDVKVAWSKFAGGNVMNDALLSGGLQFASGGVGPLITLWAKTHGNLDVKAVAAINSMPLYLVSSDPAVKTVKDFSDKDRIALPAVKVSIQAVTLQMAAEKAFGPGQEHRLDHLTVSLSHPDAMTALLSGKSEINAHFGSPPFQEQELEHPGVHLVLDSYDVLGGAATFNTVWTTAKFRNENPKIYAAFVAALDESMKIINGDKKAAAEAYLRLAKSKLPLESVEKLLNDPKIVFTTTPQGVTKYADFMYKVGSVKVKPESWKDLFFPNAYNLPGS